MLVSFLEHECGPWCGGDHHGDLCYLTCPPAEVFATIETVYAGLIEVLSIEPATEAPRVEDSVYGGNTTMDGRAIGEATLLRLSPHMHAWRFDFHIRPDVLVLSRAEARAAQEHAS